MISDKLAVKLFTMQLIDEILVKEDLKGAISISFVPGSPIDEFLEKHIENYTIERFEILAVRLYYSKEIILTVYAIDKYYLSSNTNEKVEVKKFKLPIIHLKDLLEFVAEFNFTVSTGKYPMESMEVINK